MGGNAKLRYFQSLVQLGYKEIEVSYPSASQTEFDFTRYLATTPGLVPDDVWIQVMAPCREELIRKTVEAARGLKKVIVHLHVSTSECFRRIVFNKTEEQMIDLVGRCTRLLRELTKDSPDPELAKTEWIYEFTPENFQDTSLDYAVTVCQAAKAAWEPTETHRIIFNLPSTVEVAMPNVFADQIETFCDHITEREKVCVSLHTHNDRGCAVAAAEMAQLAGADRVEGCLFGNGERTGNVDLVTLALNLFTQGVDPGIDFGDINRVVEMVEELTKIPVHMRAPYAGKYTFCTFTGTHQDAIRKGYKRRLLASKPGEVRKWEMPYLPMDPEDLGRKHEAIIRVNSQSGKGGIAWLVQQEFDLDLPLALELDFTRVVQDHATATGLEVSRDMIRQKFERRYMLSQECGLEVLDCVLTDDGLESALHPTTANGHANGHANGNGVANGNGTNGHSTNGHTENELVDKLPQKKQKRGPVKQNGENGHPKVSFQANVVMDKVQHQIQGTGPDLPTTVVNAVKGLGFGFEVLDHSTQACGAKQGDKDLYVSFVHLSLGKASSSWGVGMHHDPVKACVKAVSIALFVV